MNYSTKSTTFTDFNQRHNQNESYKNFTTNLSDIIKDIESASVLDVVQLIIEVIFTIFCIGGNFLTILVLRRAALKHPAQALRLTMAVYDLIIGILGCATSVGLHSYYLWCAIDKQRCHYEVNIIQFNDNKKMFIVYGTFPLIYFTILWISIGCNMYLTGIMSVERYFAICRPLKHRIYFTVSFIRKIVLIMLILVTVKALIWKLLESTDLKWNSFYTPDIKTFTHSTHVHTNEFITIILKIADTCSIIFNVALSLICARIILWNLRKTKKKRYQMTMTNGMVSAALTKYSKESNTENMANVEAENQVQDITKVKTVCISQQETLIDMTITQVWLIMVEVSVFAINTIVLMFLHHIATLKEPEALHPILHASCWLLLSSSSFNFIVYNVRIPAFRKASWGIITYLPRRFIVLGIPSFVKVIKDAVTYIPVCLIDLVTMKLYPLKCSNQQLNPDTGGAEVQVNVPQLIHVQKLVPQLIHVHKLVPQLIHVQKLVPQLIHVHKLVPQLIHVRKLMPQLIHVQKLVPTVDSCAQTCATVDSCAKTCATVDSCAKTSTTVDSCAKTCATVDSCSKTWATVDSCAKTCATIDSCAKTCATVDSCAKTCATVDSCAKTLN